MDQGVRGAAGAAEPVSATAPADARAGAVIAGGAMIGLTRVLQLV